MFEKAYDRILKRGRFSLGEKELWAALLTTFKNLNKKVFKR